MDFSNKVVIITGASSGIGAEVAKQFAAFNATLVLTGRNGEALTTLVESCPNIKESLVLAGDLLDEEFVKSIVTETIKKYSRIDILVNNAGISEIGNIENTCLEQYDKVMNTNVRTVYQLTNLVVPYLIKTKGNIVNVSSLGGLRSFPSMLAYCMSKSAVDQFTRCVALALAPKGVRVNAVNPGMVETNILLRAGMDLVKYQQFLDNFKTTEPLGRFATLDDVAKSIVFLASDNASFITAATLPVDGGRQASCPR